MTTFTLGHLSNKSARSQTTHNTAKALAKTKGPTTTLAYHAVNRPRALARYHDPEITRINTERQRSVRLAALLGLYDDPSCYLCGRILHATTCHLEHIIALSQGGTAHPDNLAIACPPCNHKKGARYVAFMVESRKPVFIDTLP
jgi:hypothetical protein